MPLLARPAVPGAAGGQGRLRRGGADRSRPSGRSCVDFSKPTRTDVSEIVVTAPKDAPPLATTDDLSGREVFVRKSSSYYESLTRLNADAQEPRASRRSSSRKRRRRSKTTTCSRWSTPGSSSSPSSTTSWPSSGSRSSPTSRPQQGRGRADRRRDRGRRPQEQPEAAAGGEHLDQEVRAAHGVRQHDGAAVPGEHRLREERGRRSGAEEAPSAGEVLRDLRRASTTSTTC